MAAHDDIAIYLRELQNSPGALCKLDQKFLDYLKQNYPIIHAQLLQWRAEALEHQSDNISIETADYSNGIIELAQHLEDFLVELFAIEIENLRLKESNNSLADIYNCRRKFIQRYAIRQYPAHKIQDFDFAAITRNLQDIIGPQITAEKIAQLYIHLDNAQSPQAKAQLETLAQYCAFMVHMDSRSMIFDIPKARTGCVIRPDKIAQLQNDIELGFDYRDKENLTENAYAHAKYCIICHEQGKDYCRKGLPDNNSSAANSHLGKDGCPLGQKISEMNFLKSIGCNIASLAVAMIDNPLIPATGHRICNDCMKSCIYQKQDPVNIPLIESNVLKSVLSLPWGAEIYILLASWNPLKLQAYLPKAPSGYNIFIAGLGPAGFSLSYYLTQEGHNICAIDGLSIAKLQFDHNAPIRNWQQIAQNLDQRMPQGFGGVAEYGITNRWDKNYLTLISILLQRRSNFAMHGAVRLGGNITIEQLWEDGFDHVAICTGTGGPKLLNAPNATAKGVRLAADFLMQLQQGGAFLQKGNSNLLLRLPVAVIGGGLTAIDAAVEAMHYYPLQLEKFYLWYEAQKDRSSEFNTQEQELIAEFLQHHELLSQAKTTPEKIAIMQNLGGVTIYYRRSMEQAPAYQLNHEEIEQALAIGVRFAENKEPITIRVGRDNWVDSIDFSDGTNSKAASVLIAIGNDANKFPDFMAHFHMAPNDSIFLTKERDISYFGDCNPLYAGSVVKAIASSKDNYQIISAHLRKKPPARSDKIQLNLTAKVQNITKLQDNLTELVIKAPYGARNFRPGHFFKLQNFTHDPALAMEPLALSSFDVNRDSGEIKLIVADIGKTSNLCKMLQPGQEVNLMGPTGSAIEIPSDKFVILIGRDAASASLMPVMKAAKASGCYILYIACYESVDSIFHKEIFEYYSDKVIWCLQDQPLLKDVRSCDVMIQGDAIQALSAMLEEAADKVIDRIICMDAASNMHSLQDFCSKKIPGVKLISSVNAPMQCMMKAICGQCVVKSARSENGLIFACSCQIQEAADIDFVSVQARLEQNRLFEKLNGRIRAKNY